MRTADPKNQMDAQLAASYRTCFGTDDGKRVLADLEAKFGVSRLIFHKRENGSYDTIQAAITEGERRVMIEIQNACNFHLNQT